MRRVIFQWFILLVVLVLVVVSILSILELSNTTNVVSLDERIFSGEEPSDGEEEPSGEEPLGEEPSDGEEEPSGEEPSDEEGVEVPKGSILLESEGEVIGHVFFPNESEVPDIDVAIDEGGFTLFTLGEGSVSGLAVTPVAEDVGHVVMVYGATPDGSTPGDLNFTVVLSDYVPGHVGVTQIYDAPKSQAMAEAYTAAENMHKAPNCGSEGCNAVYLWELQDGSLEILEVLEK